MSHQRTDNPPLVSLVVPTRNEIGFIGRCLDSIVSQDYPKGRMEVIVVDGISADGTRQAVSEYSKRFPFIKMIDNPRRITPCAFNAGIANSSGEIVMILGSHSVYDNGYVSKCVRYLRDFNADNVGGILITRPRKDDFTGRMIVSVLSSPFGVGNSSFRTGSKEPRQVDTVFGGCYKREVFSRIGLFNEKLESSQDMEFNLRLKRAGGKIILAPDIVSYYYARSDLWSFTKNNFRNGFWAVYPLRFVRIAFKMRHYIPLFFASGILLFAAASFLWSNARYFLFAILIPYILLNIFFSVKIAMREKNLSYSFVLPGLFFLLHFVYGVGSCCGLFALFAPRKADK